MIAIDRWGYGDSQLEVDDYSFITDKQAVLGLMSALKIKQAHIAGWSYGGGAAIQLGEATRKHILSIALIASIGIQEGEGSGSYMVEHWKYAVLHFVARWLPEAIPHFGLLGTRASRRTFARDFMDCDQRELESRLQTMHTPLLIIHGKSDPLVPAWVAQEHHRINSKSRLVILKGSHFFPFGFGKSKSFKIATQEHAAFLAAAEQGRAAKSYGVRNETKRRNMRALWNGGPSLRGYKPWGLVSPQFSQDFCCDLLWPVLAALRLIGPWTG